MNDPDPLSILAAFGAAEAPGAGPALGGMMLAVAGCGLTSLLGWLVLGTAQADLAIKAASGLGLWLVCCAVAWRW